MPSRRAIASIVPTTCPCHRRQLPRLCDRTSSCLSLCFVLAFPAQTRPKHPCSSSLLQHRISSTWRSCSIQMQVIGNPCCDLQERESNRLFVAGAIHTAYLMLAKDCNLIHRLCRTTSSSTPQSTDVRSSSRRISTAHQSRRRLFQAYSLSRLNNLLSNHLTSSSRLLLFQSCPSM